MEEIKAIQQKFDYIVNYDEPNLPEGAMYIPETSTIVFEKSFEVKGRMYNFFETPFYEASGFRILKMTDNVCGGKKFVTLTVSKKFKLSTKITPDDNAEVVPKL